MKLESKTEVTLSCADQYESKLFDREHERVLNGGKRAGLTNFQTKQIQKEAFNLLKNRRTQAMKESIQEKIDKTPSSGSAANLIESKTYENPQFLRIKDLMGKML